MTYTLLKNIVDDGAGVDGEVIEEGILGNYETAWDCNAAAAAALYSWLGENCIEWLPDGVTHCSFEGEEGVAPLSHYHPSSFSSCFPPMLDSFGCDGPSSQTCATQLHAIPSGL